MRGRAAMFQLFTAHAHDGRQSHCQFGHTQAMAPGFPVTQVQSRRPAFDGGIIGLDELRVGALKTIEEGRVFNGDGGLSSQSLQEGQPLRVRIERRAMKHVEHPLHLPFHEERHAITSREILIRQQRHTGKVAVRVAQIGESHHLAAQRRAAG